MKHFVTNRGASAHPVAVDPLTEALAGVQQSQHVTTADAPMGAEVTRLPRHGDAALPGAEAEFLNGGAGLGRVDDQDGFQKVEHLVFSVDSVSMMDSPGKVKRMPGIETIRYKVQGCP